MQFRELSLFPSKTTANNYHCCRWITCYFLLSEINDWIWVFVFSLQYLTKQNNALREVNDTRLKIYENIEISIQDLEKQNHRLNVDNSNVKKINKTSVENSNHAIADHWPF